MSREVTLLDFTPGARTDGLAWTHARMEESATATGTFTAIDSYVFGVGTQPAPDTDPRAPQARDFTTTQAQLTEGYYRIVFLDAANHEQVVGPIFVPQFGQAYTSTDSVRRVLSPDGVSDDSTAASLSDDEIEQAISEAAAEVDAKLAARYTVPFTNVPAIVTTITRDVSAYLAMLVFRGGDPIDPNDPVQLRYNRAQANLIQIQTGKTELPVDSSGPLAEGVEAAVINPYDGDLFTPGDFSLGPAPFRYPAMMPGYDDGSL
jgi:phage gp36-like protein